MDLDYLTSKHRYQDYLREVDNEQLYRQLPDRPKFWPRLLAYLGQRLVTLGQKLQTRALGQSPAQKSLPKGTS